MQCFTSGRWRALLAMLLAIRSIRSIAFVVAVMMVSAPACTQAASLDPEISSDGESGANSGRVRLKQANTRAQTLRGFAYETGQGLPQNFYLAANWYWRAANRGDVTAQYLLGLMYDKGRGVPLDTIRAQKWLILATAGALGRQRDYYRRIRDAVASKMDVDEIAQAQYLAYQWHVKHRHRKVFRYDDK